MKGLSLLPSRVMLPLSSFHVLKLPYGLVLFQETSSGKSFYAWACFLFSEEYPLLWKKNGAWELGLRLRIVKLFYSFWKARQTSEMLVFSIFSSTLVLLLTWAILNLITSLFLCVFLFVLFHFILFCFSYFFGNRQNLVFYSCGQIKPQISYLLKVVDL